MREQAPSAVPAFAPVPIGEADLVAAFAPLVDLVGQGVVLAVSGGSDSIGLMHLFVRWLHTPAWRERPRPPVHVATIDHALRPGSADDAAFVRASAHALGLPVETRRWEGAKPTSGLAEAAREARYGLLADILQQVGARLLITAHTADDQAETVLMRLARGSGVDGLAGMAPLRPFGCGTWLARPLLDLTKARIAADLTARGIGWRDDPTNADPAYERPRLRAAYAALEALGLTQVSLGRTARRARRASEALDALAQQAMCPPGVRIDPLGLVELDLGTLRAHPDEIALRLLRLAIETAGGTSAPVPLASLEDLLVDLRSGTSSAWTLARAALHVKADALIVEREPGRTPLPRVPLAAGASLLWDGRFTITARACPVGLAIGPLGADGVALLDAQGLARPKVPARTLRAIPAVWRGDDLIAAPLVGFAPQAMQLDVAMDLRVPTRQAQPGQDAARS